MFGIFMYFMVALVAISLAFILLTLAERKFPKFDDWLLEALPNQSQQETLVIIGFMIVILCLAFFR